MSFKSHIEKILCYPFKLKYLNQKKFYPTLKKHNFFLMNIEYIYKKVLNPTLKKQLFSWKHRVHILRGFKSHIEKIKYFSNTYIINLKKC